MLGSMIIIIRSISLRKLCVCVCVCVCMCVFVCVCVCIYIYIQSVTGGMCETSGECSLGQTIPI